MLNKILYQTRFLEILPGASSWTLLIIPIFISAFWPSWIACFVIIFDFYWLVRALVFGGHLISGYLKIRRDTKIDWIARLKSFKENPQEHLNKINQKIKGVGVLERRILEDEVRVLKKTIKQEVLDWEKIYNVVILPTYKEPIHVLEASIESYLASDFPNNRLIIVVAFEKRVGPEVYQFAEILKKKYKSKFKKLMFTFHPDIEGEMKGKGANATWAAHKLVKYLDEQKIISKNVIVSNFDSDTRVNHQYFACLTYKYIIHTQRRFRTFQPIPLFSNNIWQVPAFNRIVAFSSSFWQMIESTRPWRMINFSSQAMGLETLKDIDFWDRTIVSEDSRQFYRAFFRYSGNHRVVPNFCPVYMDAVLGKTLWESIKNQYLQKRRWAWGVEHFPYFIREAHKHPEIPKWEKFIQIFRMVEGHISWSTTSLLIAFSIWYPFIFHPEFGSEVLGFNLPFFAQYLLALTWVGIIISTTISTLLLPPKPKKYSILKYVEIVIQWCLVPFTALFLGSLPAVDAQTRLMIGKYLGFWVTPKEVT